MFSAYLNTPIGRLIISADEESVYQIKFSDEEIHEHPNAVTESARQQFQDYFEGRSLDFDFPMMQAGSDFQKQVWNQLMSIPPGRPISYAALSKRMNNPLAIRAIASANGRNNLMIAVPCHRVIGSNGELTGFSAGLWRKKWLLEHEAKIMGMGQSVLAI